MRLAVIPVFVVVSVFAGICVPNNATLAMVVTLGLAGVLLAARYLPELPLVILVAGMSVWALVPSDLELLVKSRSIPLTLLIGIGYVWLHRVSRGNPPALPRLVREDILLLAFTIWLAIGILWSSVPAYGQRKFLEFVAYTVGGYVMVRLGYHYFDVRRMAKLLLVAGIGHALVAINIAFESGYWSPDLGEIYRTAILYSKGLNPIAESDGLVLGLVAAVWLWLTGGVQRWTKGVLATAALVQLWALMGYQQRGAALSLLVATASLVTFLPRGSGWKVASRPKRSLFFALCVLVVLGYALYRLNPSFDPGYMSEDQNVIARFSSYQAAWAAFLSRPLVGVGTGGMGIPAGDEYIVSYPHNRVLEIMAENGLIGTLLLIGITVSTLGRFVNSLRRGDKRTLQVTVFALSGLLQRYVVAMVSTHLGAWNVGVWIAIMVGACGRRQDTERE